MLLQQEFQNHIHTFVNLVYPARCIACGLLLVYNEDHICNNCYNKIKLLHTPLCKKCSREIARFSTQNDICTPCKSTVFYFKRCFSVVQYDELTKAIFHEIKFKKRRSCITIFKNHILSKLNALDNALFTNTIVIPVPLDRRRQKERDFNQSEILAKYISSFFHLRHKTNMLKRIKQSIPQSILNKKMRLHNLEGAFCVRNKTEVNQKKVLVVDDIFTTGSTVNECAKVLKQAGATEIMVFTLARTI
ncbi:MAG: ComF family protein [Candidatus Omnitrophica bacterium]|nr:ComF family protein [Candidatus Omnitrophota bacterium]